MFEFWNKINDQTKKLTAWLLIMLVTILVVAGLMTIFPWIKKPPRSNPLRATFKKADYSSDRSWLECRDHQLICLYGGLWTELSAKEILEICGYEEVCDDLFGNSLKVEGKK
jgi:hypothetical protein